MRSPLMSRTALIALGLAVLVLALAGGRMRTAVAQSLRPVGKQILRWQQLQDRELATGERILRINGQRLRIRSEFASATEVEEKLRRVAECSNLDRSSGDLTALCIEGEDDLMFPSRVTRFSQTRDISDLGAVHFGVSVAQGDGFVVLGLHPEGDFNLDRLAATGEGDASGDAHRPDIRPAGAHRLLQARQEGEPYSIHVFGDRARTADALRAYYRAHPPSGFRWTNLEHIAQQQGESYSEPLEYFLSESDPTKFLAIYVENGRAESHYRAYATVMEAE